MFFIRIFAEPKPNTQDSKEFGGALVNCWVNSNTPEQAENYSRHHIGEDSWVATEIDSFETVEREDYQDDTENKDWLQYFLDAETDGGCLVFYTWPIDAEDADDLSKIKAR